MNGNFYRKIASYGHFGREDLSLPWENVENKASQIADFAKRYQ